MNAMSASFEALNKVSVDMLLPRRSDESTGQYLERLARHDMGIAQKRCREVSNDLAPWVDEIELSIKNGRLHDAVKADLLWLDRTALRVEYWMPGDGAEAQPWGCTSYCKDGIRVVFGTFPMTEEEQFLALQDVIRRVLKPLRELASSISYHKVESAVAVNIADQGVPVAEMLLELHVAGMVHMLDREDPASHGRKLIREFMHNRDAQAKADAAVAEERQRQEQAAREEAERIQVERRAVVNRGLESLQLEAWQRQLQTHGFCMTLDPALELLPGTFDLRRRLTAEIECWETWRTFPLTDDGLERAAQTARELMQEIRQKQALRLTAVQHDAYAQKVLPFRVIWDVLLVGLNWQDSMSRAPWYTTEIGQLLAARRDVEYYPQLPVAHENGWLENRRLERGLMPTHSGPTYTSELLPDATYTQPRALPEPRYDNGPALRQRRAALWRLVTLYALYQWRLSWTGWRLSWPEFRLVWGGRAFWRTRVYGLRPTVHGLRRWVMLDKAFDREMRTRKAAFHKGLRAAFWFGERNECSDEDALLEGDFRTMRVEMHAAE